MSFFQAGASAARWLDSVLAGPGRWLAPPGESCVWCGGRNEGGGSDELLGDCLCRRCRRAVPWIAKAACHSCGRYEACPDCVRRPEAERIMNRGAVRYDPFMKELLARYKYRGSERLAPLFGSMIAQAYRLLQLELALERRDRLPTVISYIPLSERRLQERGFNQAERLAKAVAASRRLELFPLLVRSRHTEKQSYKSRGERLDSLHGAFMPDAAGFRWLERRYAGGPCNIVLVDDVYTTGSTLHHAAEVVHAAVRRQGSFHGVRVYGVTWAR